ncbi:hypothetical protein ACEPAG_1401 [Sanghuangporus baumii]
MPPFTVPPAVASRIARYSNQHTLATLTRTTRTLQEAAEKLLYDYVELFPHPSVFPLLETLARCPRVARYVRSYVLTTNPPYRITADLQRTMETVVCLREFWERVGASLAHLAELDLLILVDPTIAQSWILERAGRLLRAAEAQLAMAWDEHVAEFLRMQDRLRCLTITEVAENVPIMVLPRDSLPCLFQFEGPLMIVDLLLHCPITHLKFPVDTEDAVSLLPLVLSELNQLKKLRSLSITMLPADMVLQSMEIISTSCPNLQYLSHIPLPMDHKSHMTLLSSLTRLPHLRVLEVDIQDWTPPLTPPFQRAAAASLRMVLPKLRYIFFWGRYERTLWSWAPEDVEPIHVRTQPVFSVVEEVQDAGVAGGATGGTGEGASESAGTGGAVATAAAVAAASTVEETISYVGLEGWRNSWSAGQNYANSTVWRTAV